MAEKRIAKYKPMKTVKDLSHNPKNPRKITSDQLQSLEKSILELGDLSGFVFNRRTGHLVGGHQRTKVIPLDAPIEIVTSYKKPTRAGTVAEGYVTVSGERFSYRMVDWDEKTELTALLSANKQGGDWDTSALTDFMKDLEKIAADFSITGFSDAEVTRLLRDVGTHDHLESESVTDLTNQWDQSSIRQMVLVMGVEQFEKVIAAVAKIKKSESLETNTEVFIYLIEKYSAKNKS